MGVKLRMKLAITSLLVLVGAASAQMQTVEDRVESGMNVWATTMAHCRENSGEGDKVDEKKFKACKKCFSGVGDWINEDGLKRGMACLQEFEPQTVETCGEMMKKLPESNFDQVEVGKVLVCWENVHLKNIGEKCLKATGDKNINLLSRSFLERTRKSKEIQPNQASSKECLRACSLKVAVFMPMKETTTGLLSVSPVLTEPCPCTRVRK